ncbi:MAG: hypothetical protein A2X86_00845 [Bdellovibrionales bacterium GWA2_49_15]|nr:MAG: hypothetical protein A2X86_00845 [Bdellovibrionales bacterium GWA2_49_15]HAZ14591.1 hypothetical protein [Bdellovibrionales bacterium]
MPEVPKEKTSTKTLEIKDVPSAEELKEARSPESTDPVIKTNRQDEEKKEKHTKILLHAREVIEKSTKEDEGIEFTAATTVFTMTDAMKAQLSTVTPGDATRAITVPKAALNADQAEMIKEKVKAHYQKKALLLETEINKILESFKTSNPAVTRRLDLIKKLLSKHAGHD